MGPEPYAAIAIVLGVLTLTAACSSSVAESEPTSVARVEADGGALVIADGASSAREGRGEAGTLAEAGASVLPDAGVDASVDASPAPVDDAAPTLEAGEPTPDSGPLSDAGNDAPEAGVSALCVGAGVVESEANETAANATPFTTSVCGTLAAGGGDKDFITMMPPSAPNFYFQIHGNVTLHVSIDGQTALVPPSPTIPFVPGKPYVIEVLANNPTSATDWRVSFIQP